MWGRDGRSLYIRGRDPSGVAGFWSIPIHGGELRLLVRLDDDEHPTLLPFFAVDTHRFYLTRSERESDLWIAELERQ